MIASSLQITASLFLVIGGLIGGLCGTVFAFISAVLSTVALIMIIRKRRNHNNDQ